ncbi:Transcription factor TFIIIB component B'' [Gossypium arboreum]|uniref:Transcription factor TFIIIB component B n=1 Tax=Gossypium arboreum TaxID=29729 RepID=A0A0B0MFH7_GOSAR|nr:Transcription factor TFIIIB component B'' [Gossypium arboreum]
MPMAPISAFIGVRRLRLCLRHGTSPKPPKHRDFRIFNFMDKPLLPKPIMEKSWKKPDQGTVKINFDASSNGRQLSFGLVARDHDGFVLGGRAGMVAQNV